MDVLLNFFQDQIVNFLMTALPMPLKVIAGIVLVFIAWRGGPKFIIQIVMRFAPNLVIGLFEKGFNELNNFFEKQKKKNKSKWGTIENTTIEVLESGVEALKRGPSINP